MKTAPRPKSLNGAPSSELLMTDDTRGPTKSSSINEEAPSSSRCKSSSCNVLKRTHSDPRLIEKTSNRDDAMQEPSEKTNTSEDDDDEVIMMKVGDEEEKEIQVVTTTRGLARSLQDNDVVETLLELEVDELDQSEVPRRTSSSNVHPIPEPDQGGYLPNKPMTYEEAMGYFVRSSPNGGPERYRYASPHHSGSGTLFGRSSSKTLDGGSGCSLFADIAFSPLSSHEAKQRRTDIVTDVAEIYDSAVDPYSDNDDEDDEDDYDDLIDIEDDDDDQLDELVSLDASTQNQLHQHNLTAQTASAQ